MATKKNVNNYALSVRSEAAKHGLAPACPECSGVLRREGPYEAPYSIHALNRTKGGFTLIGNMNRGHCSYCGAVIHAIKYMVEVELKELTCECGSTEFAEVIRSVKTSKKKLDSRWEFQVDINCAACKNKRAIARLVDFFRLKRIKVSATGVDLTMK